MRPAPAPIETAPPLAYDAGVPVAGTVPVATDPNLLLVRLQDTIASLRTALAFVGVLAVVALGVALYTLLKNDTNGRSGRGAASNARVTNLSNRVDRLSRQIQSARAGSSGSAAGLSTRVSTLSRSVSALRSQVASTPQATDPTKALQDLSTRIDTLDKQVQTLSSQAQTTTTP
jgi:outer membrane murein-binding lipoprotein Lpp